MGSRERSTQQQELLKPKARVEGLGERQSQDQGHGQGHDSGPQQHGGNTSHHAPKF